MSSVIECDAYVIVQRKSQMSLHQMPKRADKKWTVKVGRDLIDLSSGLGKPHGMFKLCRGSTGKALMLEPIDAVVELKKALLKDASSGESNQEIWDDGTSQQLKKEDIEELRSQGLSGSEILTQLVENSKTFQIKTEFSQEKYLNKKEEKYAEWVEIMKPSIRCLAKLYHAKDPVKVLNLRPDMLAMILSLANIKSGGNYAIYDGGCQGLITAAILDRIQGQGMVWNLFFKGKPQKEAIHAMNFTAEQRKPLRDCNLNKLKESLLAEDQESAETPAKIPRLDPDATLPLELGSLDGLIIASRRPSTIARELCKLLKPSASFVLFCPHIEPLSETYVQFRECNVAVNLKLAENWFRSCQVLPSRTHPDVMMSGSGGYILSGVKVVA